MKKFFATASVRNLGMSLFFLLGLMFVNAGSASAQATVGGSTNWIPDGQAQTELEKNVKALKAGPLVNLTGTDYANAEAKYHFYVGILESMTGGLTLEQAFFANLQNITSQPAVNAAGSAAANPATPVDSKAIQTEALGFLTY